MNASNSPTTQEPEVVRIAISSLRRDGGTQPRAAINHQTVTEYASDMKEGAQFPPVVVFYDGTSYWLSDGFHRVEAAWSIGLSEIAASVRQGTRRDAVLYSVGVNATHGLRRTSADKRRAIMTLLSDEEWSQWSDREIARQTRTSHPFVAKIRLDVTGNISSEKRTYITKHGTTAAMNTAYIGTRQGVIAPKLDESRELPESRSLEPLYEGNRVTIKESHSLLAGQSGMITQLPNRESAIVELDSGERELISRRDLDLQLEESAQKQSDSSRKKLVEGVNYQPGLGCEYYVRVQKSTWEQLKQYQERIGVATLDGAILRLLEWEQQEG
jgi:ParB-like nuclease domain